MRENLLLLVLCVLGLWGCATAQWSTVGGPYEEKSKSYKVILPQGWHKLNVAKDALLITKDGLLLQNISIGRIPLDQELNNTKKKISKNMLPHEVAGLVVDNIRSNPKVMNQEILENAPALISGQDGFKLVYTYDSHSGLPLKGVMYGLVSEEWFYEMFYVAPRRQYYERDVATFEDVVQSFELLSDGNR